MNLVLLLVFAAIGVGLYLNWNLGRQKERARVQQQMDALNEEYARLSGRVVEIFDAVQRAREGEGRTHAAFTAVERAFAAASGTYREASAQAEAIRSAFARGDTRPLREQAPAVRAVLARLAAELDELEAQLRRYQERWSAAPAEVAAARRAVLDLKAQVEAAEAELGFPLPLRGTLQRMEQFVAGAEAEAMTNPVAAARKAADVQANLERYAAEVALYRSGPGAVEQAERELAELQGGPAGRHPACAAHLAAAAGALADLRPHLAAGRLEMFQQRLLDLRNALRQVRQILREQGGKALH